MKQDKLFIVVNVDWFFLSHRLPVALAAQEAGWDVTIVTADTGKLKDIVAAGLKVIDLPMSRSGMNIFEELRTLWFLYKLYKRERPDVVHHVGMKTILWGTLAAKFSKVNGVVNAISGLGGFFAADNKGLLSKIMPRVLKFSHNLGVRKNKTPKTGKTDLLNTTPTTATTADFGVNKTSKTGKTLCCSEEKGFNGFTGFIQNKENPYRLLCIFQNDDDWNLYVKNGIIRHEQGRFIKGSGVDLSEFSFTPEPECKECKESKGSKEGKECKESKEGKLKVVLTARMIVEKGIFLLTEAAERLREKYEDKVEFLLVGGLDDHPGAITKEQLDEVCDGRYIKWLGYRTDVRDLLKACHIVAFPSYYMEGLPKSLIEADAIGRPVITSNSVGCKETVIDGYNGFLIEPKDVDALTEKLDLLLSDKELRQRMGMNSREYAEENFDINVVIKRHLAIYSELVK